MPGHLKHVPAFPFGSQSGHEVVNIIAGTHPRAKAPLTLGHELSGRILSLRIRSSRLFPDEYEPHIADIRVGGAGYQ
jgi:hypothetical protein